MNKELAYFEIAQYQLKLASIGLMEQEKQEDMPALLNALYDHLKAISNALEVTPRMLEKPSQDLFDDFLTQGFVDGSLPEAFAFVSASLLDAIKSNKTGKELCALIDLHISSLAYISSQILKKNLEELKCHEQDIH